MPQGMVIHKIILNFKYLSVGLSIMCYLHTSIHTHAHTHMHTHTHTHTHTFIEFAGEDQFSTHNEIKRAL